MGVQKIRVNRKKTDPTGEFLTFYERAEVLAREHPYRVFGGLGVLILVILLFWGFSVYGNAKEKSARAAYGQLIASLPRNETVMDGKKWEEAVPQLEDFVKTHRGADSAVNAKMDLARAYFAMGRYDDALKVEREALDQLPAAGSLKALVHYRMALTYQALGRTDDSIAVLEDLSKQGLAGLDREICWRLARLYADKKEYSKAVEQYDKALKEPAGYPPVPLIQQEMAAVKLTMGPQAGAAKVESPESAPQG